MIDTACSLSLISKDVFEKIPEERRPDSEDNDVRLTTADGSLLLDCRKIYLPVQVGIKMDEHPLMVAKLTNEDILRTDFLRAYGGSIDFDRKKVCLDGKGYSHMK